MPIYEYQCPQCQTIFEEWLNIKDITDTAPCPECTTKAPRIISNTAFVLKGGGWYVTEYGNRKNTSTSNTSGTSTTATASAGDASPAPQTKNTADTTQSTASSAASVPCSTAKGSSDQSAHA